jgi:hypothetical protein
MPEKGPKSRKGPDLDARIAAGTAIIAFSFQVGHIQKAILQTFALKSQILHQVSESGFHSRLAILYCAMARPLLENVALPAVHLVLRAVDSYDVLCEQ